MENTHLMTENNVEDIVNNDGKELRGGIDLNEIAIDCNKWKAG